MKTDELAPFRGIDVLIKKLEERRAYAANEAIIYQTQTGKALARGRAYAYNNAIEMVYEILRDAPPKPRHEMDDEFKEGGQY